MTLKKNTVILNNMNFLEKFSDQDRFERLASYREIEEYMVRMR